MAAGQTVRVLMVAMACQPGRGSEPGLGWAMASGAALGGHDVVLLTEPLYRPGIERARELNAELASHLHPVYFGLPAGIRQTWEQRGGLRGFQIYNAVWQVMLFVKGRKLHRGQPFAVAHHVTMSTDWVPSGLAFVRGLPLVWGPLGGAVRVPAPCRTFLSRRGRLTELARRVTADPLRAVFGSAAARRCALLLAANPEEATRLDRMGPPVKVRPNVFVDPSWYEDVPTASGDTDHPRRAVFAGRLISWKGVYLAIAAIDQPETAAWELHFYGDGPERKAMEKEIDRRGLGDRIVLHGWTPRPEIRQALCSAQVFLYPSMREASPWVVAEALAVGCPVVCLNVGGPPLLLQGTGSAVRPGPDMVRQLAQAVSDSPQLARSVVRWDAESVPALLNDWYTAASATPAPSAAAAVVR